MAIALGVHVDALASPWIRHSCFRGHLYTETVLAPEPYTFKMPDAWSQSLVQTLPRRSTRVVFGGHVMLRASVKAAEILEFGF